MKSTYILPTLLASGLAATIPANVNPNIHKRAPVCSFENHTFNDKSAWTTPSTTEKRDLTKLTWDPPSNLVTPLKQVWDHEIATYSDPLGFKNYGYDQVIAAKGKINYCVRWEGSATVSAAQRTKVETAIRRQFGKWIAILAGFEDFPYSTVDVNVVGWAVKDKSQLQGDVSGIQVYTTTDSEGIPECDPKCGRFFHQDANYASCAAGADRHYGKWTRPISSNMQVNGIAQISLFG